MKFYISFLILFFISLSSYAQIDSENNGFAIPAMESEDPKDDPELIIEPAPEAEEVKPDDTNDNEIEAPKEVATAVKPKVAFSIYKEDNNFRSSAEVFTKQLNRQMEAVEERLLLLPADANQFLGNYTTSAKKLNIQYRDFGAVDGDIIRVIINDDVVVLKEVLSGGFKGFNIDFDEGIFRIEFQALNQGLSGPNTAELRIFDENNKVIISNQWSLRTGRKAIIVLAKSEESKLQLIEHSVGGDEESKDGTTKADESKSTSKKEE